MKVLCLISIVILTAVASFSMPAVSVSAHFDLNSIYGSVSENTVSDNSTRVLYDIEQSILDLQSSIDNGISLLSDYTSYSGIIPDLYINYMRYVLSWSVINDKYVAFTSYYRLNNTNYSYYVIAVGDISFSGGVFSGNDVDVYEFFPNVTSFSSNSNYRHSIQSSFSFSPTGQLCFTDITSDYPDIRGQSDRFSFSFLVISALFVSFYVFTKFGWRNASRRKMLR